MGNEKINAEITSLEPKTLLTFFVLDATNIGGDLFRFYPGTDALRQNLVWQGVEYTPMPVEVKGYEYKGTGSPPRPVITLGNVGGQMTALCLAFDDLIGARLIKKQTFAKYLDGQPDADVTAQFPNEIFFLERKTQETKFSIEWEMATPMDVSDVALPKRLVLANLCVWRYRGTECSFAGDVVVADSRDTPMPTSPAQVNRGQWSSGNTYTPGDYVWLLGNFGIRRYFLCIGGTGITGSAFQPPNSTYWLEDLCSKRNAGCELRFGLNPFGLPTSAFPATSRL